MYELEPAHNWYDVAQPSQWFDLIVGRDIHEYYSVARNLGYWERIQDCIDFFISGPMAHEYSTPPGESPFTGYRTPPVILPDVLEMDYSAGSACRTKVLRHNPNTGKIWRSYFTSMARTPQVTQKLKYCYTKAMARGKSGGLYRGLSKSYFPLVALAKEEISRLFPNDPVIIVEINSLFGTPVNSPFPGNMFTYWFKMTRGLEIYKAYAEGPTPQSENRKGRVRNSTNFIILLRTKRSTL